MGSLKAISVVGCWRDRAITWHAHGLGQLLYELAEPDALARVIRELIQMDEPPGEPAVIHGGEAASWYTSKRKITSRKRTAKHERETAEHRSERLEVRPQPEGAARVL